MFHVNRNTFKKVMRKDGLYKRSDKKNDFLDTVVFGTLLNKKYDL